MEVEDYSSVLDSQYELSSRRELPSSYIFFISNFNSNFLRWDASTMTPPPHHSRVSQYLSP